MADLVKVGDTYMAVEFDDTKGANGKFSVRPINEAEQEQLEEDALLGDGTTGVLAEIQKAITSARDGLLDSLKQEIQSVVLGDMGFKKDNWGRVKWEIDHCNGRMSQVSNLIQKEARELLKDAGVKELALAKADITGINNAMRKELKDAYQRELITMARYEAQKIAKEHVAQIVKDMVQTEIKDYVKEIVAGMKVAKKVDI